MRWKAGDRSAGDKLVRANQKLLHRLAHKYAGRAPHDDLVQEGNLGLIRAMQLFEPERGLRFMSYAGYWARAMMQLYAHGHCSVVHTPPKRDAHSDASLDDPVFRDGDETWLERLHVDAPDHEDGFDRELVQAALESLRDGRERDIVERRFYDGEGLREIGQHHRISHERARQIERRALHNLRAKLRA